MNFEMDEGRRLPAWSVNDREPILFEILFAACVITDDDDLIGTYRHFMCDAYIFHYILSSSYTHRQNVWVDKNTAIRAFNTVTFIFFCAYHALPVASKLLRQLCQMPKEHTGQTGVLNNY